MDQCRSGYKTYVLISRREVKNRGDVDEFSTEWGIRQGFLRRTEQWETHVAHPTKQVEVGVIFPKARPPRHALLIESNRQRSHSLGISNRVCCPMTTIVQWVIKLYIRQAGLYRPGISPHTLRYAHASHALAAEMDHASIKTSTVCTHVVDAVKQSPVESL